MNRIYAGPLEEAPLEQSTKEKNKSYANVVIYDNGSITYYNKLEMTDELNRVMSRCWDSLSMEKQIEINNRIEARRLEERKRIG